MGQLEGVSTLRYILPYRKLLWLYQFLSTFYSPIFLNIFNRSDIRLDSLERYVAPKIVIEMYTKVYLTCRWCTPSSKFDGHSLNMFESRITQFVLNTRE